MKFSALEPRFIRYETRVEASHVVEGNAETWRERGMPTREVVGPKEYSITVQSLAEAQGIWFLCPKCLAENPTGVGVHSCEVTFSGKGAKDDQGSRGTGGKPTRWNVSGTGFNDLTLTPSVALIDGCAWHGFITNGEATNA